MTLDPPEAYVGPRFKFLTHAFTRKFFEAARAEGVDEVTIMHGQILGYLYRCSRAETPVYQRDLEETFHITRSSVTGVVQLMERKGYIQRRSVQGDGRLKELFLTDRGIQACKQAMVAFRQVEAPGHPGPDAGAGGHLPRPVYPHPEQLRPPEGVCP